MLSYKLKLTLKELSNYQKSLDFINRLTLLLTQKIQQIVYQITCFLIAALLTSLTRADDIYLLPGLVSENTYPKPENPIMLIGIRLSEITEYPELGLTKNLIGELTQRELDKKVDNLTLKGVQDIAVLITAMYREKGFVFTRAYVPQQESTDGIVEIRLLEGRLEAVDVYDNKAYTTKLIQSPYQNLIGQVIYSPAIGEAMALTNDIPGLSTFGFYSVGSELGGSRINLRVRNEKTSTGAIRVDDFGSDLTGKYRLFVEWEQYNLLKTGDSLRIGALKTVSPGNTTFGLINFNTLFNNVRSKLSFSLSDNEFTLGRGNSEIGAFKIFGESQSAQIGLSHKIKRTTGHNINASISVNADRSESDSERDDVSALLKEVKDTWDVNTGVSYNVVNRSKGQAHAGSLSYVAGKFTKGAQDNQSDEFSLVRVDWSYNATFTLPFSKKSHQYRFETLSQISSDSLPPDEQFSLSGSNKLRGFEVGAFSADKAVFTSLAWSLPSSRFFEDKEKKFSVLFVPQVFLEYAYGEQTSLIPGSDNDTAELSDFGIGFQYQIGKTINGRVTVARPITSNISFTDEEFDSTITSAEITWRYH